MLHIHSLIGAVILLIITLAIFPYFVEKVDILSSAAPEGFNGCPGGCSQ